MYLTNRHIPDVSNEQVFFKHWGQKLLLYSSKTCCYQQVNITMKQECLQQVPVKVLCHIKPKVQPPKLYTDTTNSNSQPVSLTIQPLLNESVLLS